MKVEQRAFAGVRVPYGTWGSSFFPAWQTSALAEVNICQFAGEAMARIMGIRGVSVSALDYLVTGSTVPWHWKFWNSPMASSCMGRRIPGCHVEQACATGFQAIAVAAGQVQAEASEVAGVLAFDRTSDSPVGVFPERRAYERTQALRDVWDNFGFDPATGKAMIACAGNAARKYKLTRREVDDLTLHRYEQYYTGKSTGFVDRICTPLEVLNLQGRPLGVVDDDTGIRKVSAEALAAMRELDTCVTAGGQTHAADGMSCLLVTTPEKARELSRRPEIDIRLLAKQDVRAQPSLMPEAPALATAQLLARTGLSIDEMKVVKSHNPFAANDAIFARTLEYDWRKMNNNGCSLVWGHPQGPTLTRLTIEALEEAVDLGGGYVLICGCAAGDVGIAALFEVADAEGGK